MIEQINNDIFRVEIPLPNTPLKTVNNYYIKGKKQSLWIDTAFNHPAYKKCNFTTTSQLGSGHGAYGHFCDPYP